MERILSKEEISELLAAVREGEIDTGPPPELKPEAAEVAPLDLLKAVGTGRWRIPNFEFVLDAFSRNFGISLTNHLQRSVTIRRNRFESMEFDKFSQGLSSREAIGIIRLDPLKSGGLLVCDSSLSYLLVEILLGGTLVRNPLMLDRPLTPIEVNLIEGVLEEACMDLARAFQPLLKVTASVVQIEVNPKLVNIVTPNTEVMVADFDVSIENFSGTISLVIPCLSLEPLREKLKDGITSMSESRTSSWEKILAEDLKEVELEMIAQSGELTMRIKDILNFNKGDIIYLDTDPNGPVRMLVGDKQKFAAQAGTHKGKKAVRITKRVKTGE